MPVAGATRRFVPATALKVRRRSLVLRIAAEDYRPRQHQVLNVYFRDGEDFLFQPWRVGAVKERGEFVEAKLAALGEPEVGCLRASQRIETCFEGMTAVLQDEDGCLVIDISEEGLGLVAGHRHPVGRVLRLAMNVRGVDYGGTVSVCSVAPAPRNRFRYGLHCEPDRGVDNLHGSLRHLWLELQTRALAAAPLPE
ncbi:MAG: hypothetical protein KDC87_12255 [Planctomycetes bacterium]|nr:hypothetical protein [Planctomycetota bacterium]